METVTNLVDFIKDEFVPEPKRVPERINKELTLDLEEDSCPFCGHGLEYYFTNKPRLLITLTHDITLRVVHRRCVNEKCMATLSKRRFYNPSLDLYMLPKKMFATDVVLLIGHLTQKENRTEEEVANYLLEEHGITISQSCVNKYKQVALALGEALIVGNAERIRDGLDKMPVRVYSVDGLSSNKSRTLFVVRDLFSGTMLGSALLDEHDAEAIHGFLDAAFQRFGRPDFMVGDGERGLIAAVRTYYSDIPYHYCHRHFLNNLGKDLMEELYKALKKNFSEKMP